MIIQKAKSLLREYFYHIVFLMTFIGFFGSLYFSEVLKLDPCYLCWWQRIFLYPMFILTSIKLAFKKSLDKVYILALSLTGNAFALYHVLVQEFGLGKDFLNCAADNPCDVKDVQIFGFFTIPILSLLAFTTISVVTILVMYWERKEAKAEAV